MVQNFNIINSRAETPHQQLTTDGILPFEFVAYKYDDFWWVGIIEEMDSKYKDATVIFMHLMVQKKRFTWQSTADVWWTPIANILMKLLVPMMRPGRIYDNISDNFNTIVNSF